MTELILCRNDDCAHWEDNHCKLDKIAIFKFKQCGEFRKK
jgi:hypothetical protein